MRRRFYLLLIAVLVIAAMVAVSCGGDDITGVGRSSSSGNTGDNGDTGNSGQTDAGAYPHYTYYRIRVPFAVGGDAYTNVSYRDTNTLKQLWFDQINRKAANDGKVFAIRNRANDRGANNFQNKHSHNGHSAQDYYYFNENGDIVWKEDNNIIKKFVGAVITGYRDVTKKMGAKNIWLDNSLSIKEISWREKGIYTIGAIYANTLTTDEARSQYTSSANVFKDGVYDFVTYRHHLETFNNGAVAANAYFERQYTDPGFIEVLVMYDYDNWGISGAASVHSYYPYYGTLNNTNGFTAQNMPYMTNQNYYLGQRPEYITKQLNRSAAFSDWDRWWAFLFVPGQKDVDTIGRKASASNGQLPRW